MSTDWRKSYEVVQEPLGPLVQFVPAEEELPSGMAGLLAARVRILIYTIHDGSAIPAPFWDVVGEGSERERRLDTFEDLYVLERDWGADLVAKKLVAALNREGYRCEGFYRVNIARVLMDFGRFPGNTPPEADHLHRFAINYPFSRWLDYDGKKRLLEEYYDKISEEFEKVVFGKHLTIALHTYDRFNRRGGTERPLMSIITRPIGYQTKSEMPLDFFDSMYPPVLAEYTADRKLTYRLSLMLEKAGIAVAHNYPYNFPDGSMEVRSQVWNFFQYLRQNFEESYPATRDDAVYQSVWELLLDTNLRSTQSENLRSYLHMFRKAPAGKERIFQDALDAYREIKTFLLGDQGALIKRYRNAPSRMSSLGIEVRKDFVWDFTDKMCREPQGPKVENAELIARHLARALMVYLSEDRVHPQPLRSPP